jgi:hypothetical protein
MHIPRAQAPGADFPGCSNMVPHLTTALTGPLLALEQKILDAMPAIEHWFRGQWQKHTQPAA